MYNDIEEAIHFIFLAFKGKKRTREDVDLVFHSIMVGTMLQNNNLDKDIVLTGYLHDVIEDTNFTYNDIEKRFSKKIAEMVLNLTENENIESWVERKKEYIKTISNSDTNIVYVSLADKLHNLTSDYNLFLEQGEDGIATKYRTFEELKWFHLELNKIFNERIDQNDELLIRYNKIVESYFGNKKRD